MQCFSSFHSGRFPSEVRHCFSSLTRPNGPRTESRRPEIQSTAPTNPCLCEISLPLVRSTGRVPFLSLPHILFACLFFLLHRPPAVLTLPAPIVQTFLLSYSLPPPCP